MSDKPGEYRPAWAAHRAALPIGVAVAVLLEFVAYRYGVGLHNQALQLPYVFKLLDPTLYPGDALVDSMDAYTSAFWPAVAMLARVVPLEPLLFVLHLATNALKFAGIACVARALAPERPLAGLAAMFALVYVESPIGHESLHWFYTAHTPVGTALALFAIAAALRGRWWWAFGLAGVVFQIHAIQAAYLLLMFGPVYLWEFRRMSGRDRLAPAGFALLAAPVLVWMARSGAAGAPDDFVLLMRNFFPWHFFPDIIGDTNWYKMFAICAALAGAGWHFRRSDAGRRILFFLGAMLVFWGLGGELVDDDPTGILLKLHIYRSASYVTAMAVAAVTAWFVTWLMPRVTAEFQPWFLAATLLFVLIFGSVRPWDYAELGAWLRVYAGVFGVLLTVGLLTKLPRLVRLVAWVGCVYLSIGVGAVLQGRLNHATEHYYHMNWPLKQAQLWARENTPKDALFLTYPDAFGFRVFSRRASVGEWLDGAGVLWSTEYADYWRDWVQRVGMTLDKRPKEYIWSRIRRGWKAKTGPEIEAIAAHYGADYLLLSKPSPQELEKGITLPEWRGEVVYENDSVVIYTVPADLVAPGESGQ